MPPNIHFGLCPSSWLQDDEINLQSQLVEKLKKQMLDQEEVENFFVCDLCSQILVVFRFLPLSLLIFCY